MKVFSVETVKPFFLHIAFGHKYFFLYAFINSFGGIKPKKSKEKE